MHISKKEKKLEIMIIRRAVLMSQSDDVEEREILQNR
jgi:hypothetical protein